jgi:hypothetical protein
MESVVSDGEQGSERREVQKVTGKGCYEQAGRNTNDC